MEKITRIGAALLLILGFAGCASGPELADYPRRQLDRPYTLPNGVDNWQTTIGVWKVANQYGLDLPMDWQESLSDD